MSVENLEKIYPNLFLNQEDFSVEKAAESKHSNQPEIKDTYFQPCAGLKSGFQVWQSVQKENFRRMVDIRWLFDSQLGAKRYHRLQMRPNSENFPTTLEEIQCGEGLRVFSNQDPFGMNLEMFIYLFTLGPVCCKLFFTGYSETERHEMLQKASNRIQKSVMDLKIPLISPTQDIEKNMRWPQGKYQYEQVLLEQILNPGIGIGNILTFNHTIADMYQTIGGGDEDMNHPFEYFFEHGFFAIAVKGVFGKDQQFHIVQIRYYDDPYKTLKTSDGITMGSSRSMILSILGKPTKEMENWNIYNGISFRFDSNANTDMIVLTPNTK